MHVVSLSISREEKSGVNKYILKLLKHNFGFLLVCFLIGLMIYGLAYTPNPILLFILQSIGFLIMWVPIILCIVAGVYGYRHNKMIRGEGLD